MTGRGGVAQPCLASALPRPSTGTAPDLWGGYWAARGIRAIFVVTTEIFLLLEGIGTHRSFHRNSTSQNTINCFPRVEL